MPKLQSVQLFMEKITKQEYTLTMKLNMQKATVTDVSSMESHMYTQTSSVDHYNTLLLSWLGLLPSEASRRHKVQ